MKNYKAAVYIETAASKYMGEVEFDSIEEYNEKAQELWDSKDNDYPTTNITNNFDLGDWELANGEHLNLKYCENK